MVSLIVVSPVEVNLAKGVMILTTFEKEHGFAVKQKLWGSDKWVNVIFPVCFVNNASFLNDDYFELLEPRDRLDSILFSLRILMVLIFGRLRMKIIILIRTFIVIDYGTLRCRSSLVECLDTFRLLRGIIVKVVFLRLFLRIYFYPHFHLLLLKYP